MFGDETNRLIDEALSARDAVSTARSTAKEKAAARQAAEDEANAANAGLQSSNADLTRATQAAIAAITAEFNPPNGGEQTAVAGQRPPRPFLAPGGTQRR